MNDLVSIIVPVYKVEEYIDTCIQSILNQTYENIEVILVDDGSPDNCGGICDNYAVKDKRVKVVHKVNGGLSSARNAGLDIMQGQYVAFIDSDDYVTENYIEVLYTAIRDHQADIAICTEEYVCNLENGETKKISRPYREFIGKLIMTPDEALAYSLCQDLYEASAWAKLYKAKLFKNIRFPVGYAYEDQGTVYKAFLKSSCVVAINDRMYFYLQRNGSILHTRGSSKRFWDGVEMVEKETSDIVKAYPNLMQPAASRLLSMYFHSFIGACIAKDYKLMDYTWNGIKRLRGEVVFYSRARRKTRIASMCSFLGRSFFIHFVEALSKN